MQFRDVIGQEKAKLSFVQSAGQGRISHALLLSGPNGSGKLPFALSIAQYLNCDSPANGDSCGVCPSCLKTAKLVHPDLRFVLPALPSRQDTKSGGYEEFIEQFRSLIKANPYPNPLEWPPTASKSDAEKTDSRQAVIYIDIIRELKRKLVLKSFEGKYKIVIVWQAEKINVEASNAFLKLLEEPPENTVLILTTADEISLLPTIRSRCQRISLQRLSELQILQYFQKYFTQQDNEETIEDSHLQDVAKLTDGNVHRARELLIGIGSQQLYQPYIQWIAACYQGNLLDIRTWVDEMAKKNKNYQRNFLTFAQNKLRDSMLYKFESEQLTSNTPQEATSLKKFGRFLDIHGIEALVEKYNQTDFYLSRNANAQIVWYTLSLQVHAILKHRAEKINIKIGTTI